MDIETIKTYIEPFATAIVTTVVVVGALWSKLKTANQSIKIVKDQVTPNGGASLVDKVNKVLAELSSYRRAIMDLVPEPMYKTTASGSCIWINIAYTDRFGIPKETAAGFGWVEVIHSEDRARVREEFNQAVQDKRMFDQIYRMRNRITEKEFKVHGRAVPILDDKLEVVAYLGIINILE